jgi:phosphatidylglycerophosphate synthase
LTVLVLDAHLRPAKQLVLAPVADRLGRISPQAITVASVVFGLAAAVAAAGAMWWFAVVLFLVGRLLDGLDGEVARGRSVASDAGGYADIVADTAVYAAVPIGAAIGSSIDHIWPVTAVLLASFYVNTITWSYLSALIEKRRAMERSDRPGGGRGPTSVAMPPGLVEGFETIIFFTVVLAIPRWMDWTMGLMAAAVTVGAVLRFIGGRRQLSSIRYNGGDARAGEPVAERGSRP